MGLSESERRELGERAARLEARTGVEAVAAVIDRCDAYPEIPWKAFALFSGLGLLAVMFGRFGTVPGGLTFLLGGAAAALTTLFLPGFARLFADAQRRENATRRYAASFFLDHDLSRTRRRRTILMLVGVFERSMVVLTDCGLPLDEGELQEIIARMRPRLAAGQVAPALRDGLDTLEMLLVAKGFDGGAGEDEIEQEIIEEKGA